MSAIPTYRLLFLLLLSAGSGLRICAQTDYPYAVSPYPFVDAAASVLQYPGNANAMAPLYARMDKLMLEGQGRINIVHFGGSHVQADTWTDRMRQRLQTAFEGARAGRGMIFPYKIAKTNGPRDYTTSYTGTWETCKNIQANKVCTLGITGYSVTTRDTFTTIQLAFREPEAPHYDFNRVRVFHDLDSSSYEMRVLVNGQPVPSRRNTSLGYTEYDLGGYHQTLSMEILRTDSMQTHFSLYGISLDSDAPGFVYHAFGVNGASTGSYRRCELFTQQLKALEPDLVLFSIGINDANTLEFDKRAYAQNYDTLVARVRSANPRACILFTTNTDSYYKKKYPNKNAAQVRDVMLQLAKKHNAVVWDTWAVMGGLGSIKHWIKAGLAQNDKVHLLPLGYELLADHLFNALMQDYDRHLRLVYENKQ